MSPVFHIPTLSRFDDLLGKCVESYDQHIHSNIIVIHARSPLYNMTAPKKQKYISDGAIHSFYKIFTLFFDALEKHRNQLST